MGTQAQEEDTVRIKPTDESEHKELAKLNAEPWMVELLALNPDYPHWGPHEDYMLDNGKGWRSPIFSADWPSFDLELDELNEVVNFYFAVERDSEECTACGGCGYNPATKQIADDFYDFAETGRRWVNNITQDEADALVKHDRLRDLTHEFIEGKGWVANGTTPSAADVNEWSRRAIGHDAINRWILVRARAERLGVYGKCETCEGDGSVFTAPAAHVELVLWLLHPRKGASRGVEIKRIEQNDLPAVFAFLSEAASRNAQRFAGVVAKSNS